MPTALPVPPVAGRRPTAADVVRLQAVRGCTTASVLLSTRPAATMTPDDAARLGQLVADAERRLRLELPAAEAVQLADALRSQAADAERSPTHAAVALFAGPTTAEWFTLPVEVRSRTVVDPSFATRDLVRALHRTPRHTVLLLAAGEARLFEGVDGRLDPVTTHGFPLRGQDDRHFLRAVDTALGRYRRQHPSPLVLCGVERVLAEFRKQARHAHRLAGTVPGAHLTRPIADLVPLVRPVLDRYLRSREAEALEDLAGTPWSRVASGLEAVWLAARTERPRMLVVEEDLFAPALVTDGGLSLVRVDDPELPGALDDAVDEVIEVVLRRGGWVALASPGALADHDGIALTVSAR